MRVLNDWLLTPERAALHLPSGTAVVADLHLGYDHARRRAGEAVPLRPLDEQLGPLESALARHGMRRLVVAGDLLEDGGCRGPADELRRRLEGAGVELVAVVPGNHDRGLAEEGAARLPVCTEFHLGDWLVVHGDGRLPGGALVHGHEHPWVRWTEHLSAPCYLVGVERLVLPAFSADAAGVNVLGAQRWRAYRCCVIAGDRVLDFGAVGGLRRRVRAVLRG